MVLASYLWGYFLSTMLQYKRHFATTAFSTALLNISLIIALLLSEDKSQSEIVYYLSFGVVIGGILQLIAHIIALYNLALFKPLYGGFKYIREKSHLIKEDSKKFKKQFFPAMWGTQLLKLVPF